MRLTRINYWTLGALCLIALTMGCGTLFTIAEPTPAPTVTPYSTYTPFPTLTPYPTYTPVPPTATPTISPTPTVAPSPKVGDEVNSSRWTVRVLKAEKGDQFGSFSMKAGATTQMVIVTVGYTYRGRERTDFSPETVVLMNLGAADFGWARTPILYNADSFSSIDDLTKKTVFIYLQPGASHTDVFVYEFPKSYTEFRLFFPETQAIAISMK